MFDDDFIYVSGKVLRGRAAGEVDGERTAPRHQPAAPERHVRRPVRHLSRSPERLQLLHEPARRVRRPGRSRTRATPTPTGIRCGRCAPGGSRAGGPSRWRSRSSRSATSPERTRPGASSCGASIRRKNEWTHLTARAAPRPAVLRGIFRVSRAGDARRPRSAAGEQEHRAEAVRRSPG